MGFSKLRSVRQVNPRPIPRSSRMKRPSASGFSPAARVAAGGQRVTVGRLIERAQSAAEFPGRTLVVGPPDLANTPDAGRSPTRCSTFRAEATTIGMSLVGKKSHVASSTRRPGGRRPDGPAGLPSGEVVVGGGGHIVEFGVLRGGGVFVDHQQSVAGPDDDGVVFHVHTGNS